MSKADNREIRPAVASFSLKDKEKKSSSEEKKVSFFFSLEKERPLNDIDKKKLHGFVRGVFKRNSKKRLDPKEV